MAQLKAVWNSKKGYSKPDEVVTVLQTKNGLAQINVSPDEDEKELAPEGFWYWVPVQELKVIQ